MIDDEREVHELLTRYLTKEGFEVLCAADGEEGLRLAREHRPCAVTVDVIMPGIDGWEVLRRIKMDPELSATPVIMVSVLESRDTGFSLGASDYVFKPIDREQLLAALRKHSKPEGTNAVLVVEDDLTTRELMTATIAKAGWTVAEAENGTAALEELKHTHPDLILLDLVMPVMDGFQFMEELRKSDDWREIPVVVITAKDVTQRERDQLNGQVRKILQKGTYTRDDLLREVASTIRQNVHGAVDV